MRGRTKFFLTLFGILFLFIAMQVFFVLNRSHHNRNVKSLINQYYQLMKTDPDAAKRALEIILQQNPHNKFARRELAYWYLKQGDTNTALQEFKLAFKEDPTDAAVAFELGRVYAMMGNYHPARHLLNFAIRSNNPAIKELARKVLVQLPAPAISIDGLKKNNKEHVKIDTILHGPLPTSASKVAPVKAVIISTPPAVPIKPDSRTGGLNLFYQIKNKESKKALLLIKQLVKRYPLDITILKEGGYLALQLHDNNFALLCFARVYRLTYDPKFALQIAYIYDSTQQKRLAYYYFGCATHTQDAKDRMTAELAKTNLRGAATKILPQPYYLDFTFTPISFSRFHLVVYDTILKLGKVINEKFQWKTYLFYHRTWDNKSGSFGLISQVYTDNVSIVGAGTEITPIPHFPMIAFFQLGKANDLVYRNRSRWRSDLRYGLAYYNEWGMKPSYTFKPELLLHFQGDAYTDIIYFSRFRNTIATARLRPALKVFRWGSATIDLYYKGFVIQDTLRQFYNNLMEYGPGIAFTPSDRYNVTLRYENLRGHYLPSNTNPLNPYKPNYHNNIFELDAFFRF